MRRFQKSKLSDGGPVNAVVLSLTPTCENAMYRLISLTVVATVITGCGDPSTIRDATSVNSTPPRQSPNSTAQLSQQQTATEALSDERISFGTKWKAAALEDRRAMADVAKVGTMFQGVTKTEISELFGDATQAGVDKFGEDVLRYELGDVPEADGGGKYHLTFVFEDNVVVRVMGNFFSLTP